MVDRISSLPNELLCHILSFLPTNLAFTTTIISKRWSQLFYSLLVLHFHYIYNGPYVDHNENFRHRFSRYVDNIMFSPLSINQPLKTFTLNLDIGYDYDHVENRIYKTWLDAAIRRHVEYLNVSLHANNLNPNVIISQTLVFLKINRVHFESDTSCIHLPSLKTLHLYAGFLNQNDYENFLSGCPNLEDLHTENIYIIHWLKRKRVRVNRNKKGLRRSSTLSKLVRVSIGSSDAMCNVIHNVKFLSIITRFDGFTRIYFKVIPVFSSLTHLHIVLVWWSYYCWEDIVQLIHHCPNLQILFIAKWKETRPFDKPEWECPIPVLECLSSHLRSCTILKFDGSVNDLRFATYILQNASLLQDMKVGVTANEMFFEKSKIIDELSSCPRLSPGCKLSFETDKDELIREMEISNNFDS